MNCFYVFLAYCQLNHEYQNIFKLPFDHASTLNACIVIQISVFICFNTNFILNITILYNNKKQRMRERRKIKIYKKYRKYHTQIQDKACGYCKAPTRYQYNEGYR